MIHIRSAAAAVVGIALTLSACDKAQGPSAPATPARGGQAAPVASSPGASPVATAPAPAPARDISRVVALDSIGATKEFLERTLGQSTYETPREAKYSVGGCNVAVTLGTDRAVEAVRIDLEKGCRFDASGITGSDGALTIDGPVTFAEYEKAFGRAHYTAPCLARCGNAFDPYVDAVVSGSRANGVIDIAAQAVFVEDAVIAASNVWEEKLVAKRGEPYVAGTRFNCEGGEDDIPRAAFAQVTVQSLQFGRNLGTSDCD